MDTRIRALLWTAAALLVAGCAASAPPQAQPPNESWRSALSEAKACESAVYNAPESAPIRRHAPHNPLNATVQQLSDPAMATDDEIMAINWQRPRLQRCRNAALESLATVTPAIVPILIDEYKRADRIAADLVQRKISWGTANMRSRDLVVWSQQRLGDLGRQIQGGASPSGAAAEAQQQAAVNAMDRYFQSEQRPAP